MEVTLAVVLIVGLLALAFGRDGAPAAAAVPEAPPAGADDEGAARLRVVAVARCQDVLYVDALIDAVGRDLDAPVGTPVTLEIRAPEEFWLELSVERLLEAWVRDSRVVDVVVHRHPAGTVATLRSQGSVVHLPLVGGIAAEF
jgi:hypothetical protein